MPEPLGYHYGRADLERIGLFAEMEYMHGKGYTGPVTGSDIRDMHGAQMNPGVPKWKTGLQDCYFDQKFKRIFEKEAYTTPYIMEVNHNKEMKKKYPNLKTFIPASYPKKHATPGDYFGCFSGTIPAFSPVKRPRVKEAKLPLNFKVNPGKKGGPGYTDICINKYPEYKSSPYDDPRRQGGKGNFKPFLSGNPGGYFDKNPYYETKIQATYKEEFTKSSNRSGPFYPSAKNKTLDGCFDKYPEYKSSPYVTPSSGKVGKGKESGLFGPFRPQPSNKSMYTRSIMNNKVDIALNAKNWRNFKPITYTREFLV